MDTDSREIVSYGVSLLVWLQGLLPHSYKEWTDATALLIAIITLFFITIPKAWMCYRDYRKRKDKK